MELGRERFVNFLDAIWGDLRFALRSFRRAPGMTAAAVVTLAGGIAALISLFSFYDAFAFGALPYHDASRLVAVSEQRPHVYPGFLLSFDAARLVRDRARSFERVAFYSIHATTVAGAGDPDQISALAADTAFLPLFDVRPELGRALTPEEIVGNARVVMVSDVFWRARFGADRGVIGKSIQLDRQPYTVVGVLPPGFRFPWQTDVIRPLSMVADSGDAPHALAVSLVAKLRPGVDRRRARAEISVLSKRLASIDAHDYRGASLVLRDEPLDRRLQNIVPFPSLFFGAGLMVLIVACANVTNLLLTRAVERRGEMAIRASMGAGRSRLIRQTLTESLLLAAGSAALGLGLSMATVRVFLHLIPTFGFPSWFHWGIDVRVAAATIATMVFVAVVVGLTPAREGTRFDLVRALKGAGDGGASARHATRAATRGLVTQLALSVALATCAMLFLRSYEHITHVDLGYEPERVAVVEPLCNAAEQAGDVANCTRFVRTVAGRATAIPGIQVATSALFADFNGHKLRPGRPTPAGADRRIIPDGDTTRAIRNDFNASVQIVSPGYFPMLGLKVQAGRLFASSDADGAAPVAVIGAHAAQRLWGKANPIGHTMQFGAGTTPVTVIGVVNDIRDMHSNMRSALAAGTGAFFYLSVAQAYGFQDELLAVGNPPVQTIRKSLLALVRQEDPSRVVFRETTLADQGIGEHVFETELFGGVIGALAASAVLLSVVGIYGVIAFGVARRTREIGIRVALGATSAEVIRMVTTQGARFAAVGVAIGLVLSTGASRLLRLFLFEVSPLDPTAYALVCVLFGAIALVACYLPARRAARVDPLVALRSE